MLLLGVLYVILLTPPLFSTPPNEPVKRDVQDAPPSMDTLLSHHLYLARILELHFIHVQLFKKKIEADRVLAGVYGFKERVAVLGIAQFDDTDFPSNLQKLAAELPNIPNTVENPFNLDDLETSRQAIDSFNFTQFEWIRETLLEENIPYLAKEQTPSFLMFSVSPAQKVLNMLEMLKSGNVNVTKVYDVIKQIKFFESYQEEMIRKQMDEEEENKKLMNNTIRGFQFAKMLQGNESHFKRILEAYEKTSPLMEYQKNPFPIWTLFHDVVYLHQWFKDFQSPPGELHIGASFEDKHLYKVFDLLKHDQWIRNILNNGLDLQNLEKLLNNMLFFTKEFENARHHLDMVAQHKDAQRHIDSLKDLVDDMLTLFTFYIRKEEMKMCLRLSDGGDKIPFDDLLELQDLSDVFYEYLPTVFKAFNNSKSLAKDIKRYIKFPTITKDILRNWNGNRSEEFKKLQETFVNAAELFEQIRPNETVKAAIISLNEMDEKIESIKKWISLDEDSCRRWVPIDVGNFTTYNTFPATLARGTDPQVFQGIHDFLPKIRELRGAVKNLESIKIGRPAAVINGRDRTIYIHRETLPHQKPDTLTQIGNAVNILRKVYQIYKKEEDVKTLLELGDTMVKNIQTIQHPRQRIYLDEAWEDWDETKEALNMVSESAKQVISQFNTTTESSLWEVGRKYLKISHIRFTKSIYHKPDFNIGNKIATIKYLNLSKTEADKLHDVLESLKEPLTADWTWANARLDDMPLYMEDVQKAMTLFFEEEKKPEMSREWRAEMDERRKREAEEKENTTFSLEYYTKRPLVPIILAAAAAWMTSLYFVGRCRRQKKLGKEARRQNRRK